MLVKKYGSFSREGPFLGRSGLESRRGRRPPEPRRGGHISAQGKRSVALGRGSHRWKARPANRGTGFFYFDTTTPQGVIDMASQKC